LIARTVAAIIFGASALVAQPAGAQIIDRILAVVSGTPITLSDVTAALRFGLVPTSSSGGNVEQGALDALIDRNLQLVEVNRYLPPEPSDAEIASRMAAIQSRFPSEAAFDAALNETGVDRTLLTARIRDTIRIETYVQQRFGSAFQASDEDVLRYYRTHPSEFTRGGALRPFADVRDEARQKLLDERATTLMRDWMAGLRRRAEISVLVR
jgi:parvulin-like peptidyl-prolyl isomerase